MIEMVKHLTQNVLKSLHLHNKKLTKLAKVSAQRSNNICNCNLRLT